MVRNPYVRSVLFLAIATACVFGVVATASAGAIITPSGYNANAGPTGDDSASGPHALPFSIDYLGTTRSQFWMCTNGYITLDSAFTAYNSSGPLVTYGHEMIAPFFTDQYSYGGNTSFGSVTWNGRTAECVNWINNQHFNDSVPHSYQLVLIDRSDRAAGDFDLMLNYDLIPDGPHASSYYERAGFTDASFSYELPGSGFAGPFHDQWPTGLVAGGAPNGQPGRYYFVSRAGVFFQDIDAPATSNDASGPPPIYLGSATISLTASDGPSGSGVLDTQYRLDGGDWISGAGTSTAVPGVHTLEYYSVDMAGNREPANEITFYVATGSPTAFADEYHMLPDTVLTVPASGVLANDFDAEADPLSAVLDTDVTGGVLALASDGSFTYTAAAGFEGVVTFTYHANDGATDSSSAMVTIYVDRAPETNPDAYACAEDSAIFGGDSVLLNDTDADLDDLTAALESGVSSGALTFRADGTFDYVPNANFNGTDQFTYRASDGLRDSGVETVTITVNPMNDVPSAGYESYAATEDTPLVIEAPGLLANDVDIDGDLLASYPYWNGVGGVAVNIDGSFTYFPAANWSGAWDSFYYQIVDGNGGWDYQWVDVWVEPVNDAPVAVEDTGYACAEDTSITGAASVLGNDSDIDGGPLSAVLDADVASGTLALNADGTFDYTPDANFFGTDQFTYHANDGSADSNVVTVTISVSPVDDPPIPVDDEYFVDEDGLLVVPAPGVLGNDIEYDGERLDCWHSDGPYHAGGGGTWIGWGGDFSYAPEANWHGDDTMAYIVIDAFGTWVGGGDVVIHVASVEDTPVAVADAGYACDEDTSITGAATVLGNDSDADLDPLGAVLDTDVSNGTLTLYADGTFDYTPDADFNGADQFTYHANDGDDDSNVVTVDITVNSVEDVPVAVADAGYACDEDTSITGAATVLGNDSDADLDPLGAVLDTDVSNGTLTLYADGTFDYTPGADFNGADQFTYHANDGDDDSNVVTVDITVNAVNDAPVAAPDGLYETDEDVPITGAASVLGNDGDLEGDPLSAVLDTDVSNGTLTLYPDGTFDYAPNPDYNGPDSFTYRANDGAADSNVVTVDIWVYTIPEPPVAVGDSYTVAEDSLLVVGTPGFMGNDYDGDGDWIYLTQLTSYPSHGQFIYTWDGGFVYSPDPDFSGTDSFTYEITDGWFGPVSGTVTLTVDAVNDAPVIDQGDSTYRAGFEDAPIDVLLTATDAEGDVPWWEVTGNPGHGEVYGGGIDYTGPFTYVPEPGWSGSDAFLVSVIDPWGGSDTIVVNIEILEISDAPVAVDDGYGTSEDGSLIVNAGTGVLANDGAPGLTAVLASPPSNGGLVLFPDGGFFYTPAPGFSGVDTFTYNATDGYEISALPATVTIDVAPVNDAPVITQGSMVTVGCSEDNWPTAFSLTLDATDADGDALTWTLGGNPAHGAASADALGASAGVSYQPDADWSGSDLFTVTVIDGNGGSASTVVRVNVAAVNDGPVAVDDEFTTPEDTPIVLPWPVYAGNDYDIDGDVLDWWDVPWLVSGPCDSWTFYDPGYADITMVPVADEFGDVVFGYNVCDYNWDPWNGYQVASGAITVHITPVNDAPSFVTLGDVTVAEDSGPYAGPQPWASSFSVGPANEAAQTWTLETTNDNEALFAVQPDVATDGTLSFEPAADAVGTANVTVVMTDDDTMGGPALTFTRTFVITVTPGNDGPDAVDDDLTVNEDDPETTVDVLANDTDPDGDTLTVVSVTQGAHGAVTLTGGVVGYTPEAGYGGPDAFTYTVDDGFGLTDIATVVVTVIGGNDAPTATGESYIIQEDVTLSVAYPGLHANDSDPEMDEMHPVLVTPPSNGTLDLQSDGSFSYEPSIGWSGSDYFTYRASDGTAESNEVTVGITVTPVDTAHTRIEGLDRIATTLAASRKAFASADEVLIATSENWPDSLGGAALAGALRAPILITSPTGLDARVLAEIDRLGAQDAIVLGGSGAVSPAVFDQLVTKLGSTHVRRIGGIDRYATAAMVASEAVAALGPAYDGNAFLATGRDFPDALSASPIAYKKGWPILLAHPVSGLTAPTTSTMAAIGVEHVIVLGGSGSVSNPVQAALGVAGYTNERVSGSDRYAASAAIAEFGVHRGGLNWTGVGIATGQMFPDALAGGPVCGEFGVPILLNPTSTLHPVVSATLQAHRSQIDEVFYFGGSGAVSESVRDQISSLLR